MTKFKKGDAVYRFASWNDRGTFYITKARIYSCGAKRMVIESDTGRCIGRDFQPHSPGIHHRGEFQTQAMVEEQALTYATAYIAAEIARLENNIKLPAYHAASIQNHIDAIKANGPQFIWRD